MKKIGIASDHGGRILKDKIMKLLKDNDYQITDFGVGVNEDQSVDYPDYAGPLASAISKGTIPSGIAVCGTGIGMCIAANKFKGVRATSVWDEFTAEMSRAHNNSNIICLGERVLNHDRALTFLTIWLNTEFEARHQKRLDKVDSLETP